MSLPKVHAGGIIRTSLDNTWRTPEYILDAARAYFGGAIPFDPATTNANPTAAMRYCALPAPPEEREPSLFGEPEQVGTLSGPDGLSIAWDAPTWVNPPYGEFLRAWLLKIVAEAARGTPIISLIPCSRWEQGYLTDVLAAANAVCFHRGRISFISSIDNVPVDGNPTASMLLGFNVDEGKFRKAFRDIGACFGLRALSEAP